MQVKTKKSLNNLIKKLTVEIFKEDLEEATVTGDVQGYQTPYAFTGKRGKKKKKKISKAAGYKPVKEALEDRDLKLIKKTIRDEVANILRDIWLKRTSWKGK
tara:strand:- start:250 stop:555 length:306 start_codon:yes stop_codon:yes gene_type:complete